MTTNCGPDRSPREITDKNPVFVGVNAKFADEAPIFFDAAPFLVGANSIYAGANSVLASWNAICTNENPVHTGEHRPHARENPHRFKEIFTWGEENPAIFGPGDRISRYGATIQFRYSIEAQGKFELLGPTCRNWSWAWSEPSCPTYRLQSPLAVTENSP